MGHVHAICISKVKGTKKEQLKEIELVESFGLKGDAHGGNWHRQVSLLDKKEIDAFNEKGGNVIFGDFGENFVIEGIDLVNINIGERIQIGDAIIEITQKGKECHSKCEIFNRVGECIMPKRGVFAIVIKGGKVSLEDQVSKI